MRNILFILIALMAGMSMPAQAGVKSLTVKVDGLACPFCAYGLEKKLKKVEGVEKLNIDINAGEAVLEVKAGTTLTAASGTEEKAPAGLVAQVQKAVKEGGFTPRELVATVEGQVVAQEGTWRLRVIETGEVLALKNNGKEVELQQAASKGPVTLTGALQTEGSALTLTVERIDAQASIATELHRLKLSGMVCSGCADAIKATLEGVNGVQQAEVNLEKGPAEVTVAAGKINAAQLVEAVNGSAMEGMSKGTFQASVLKE